MSRQQQDRFLSFLPNHPPGENRSLKSSKFLGGKVSTVARAAPTSNVNTEITASGAPLGRACPASPLRFISPLHGGQGENLVPPYTRGRVSLSLSLLLFGSCKPSRRKLWLRQLCGFVPESTRVSSHPHVVLSDDARVDRHPS